MIFGDSCELSKHVEGGVVAVDRGNDVGFAVTMGTMEGGVVMAKSALSASEQRQE